MHRNPPLRKGTGSDAKRIHYQTGNVIQRKEDRERHFPYGIGDWDLFAYRKSRVQQLPLIGSFYGLELQDSVKDLEKMEEMDKKIMMQKQVQEKQDTDRMVIMQSLFRENYRHWERVGYTPPKNIFSSLARKFRETNEKELKWQTISNEFQSKSGKKITRVTSDASGLVPPLKPQVKRGRSNSDSHVYKFVVIDNENSNGEQKDIQDEEEYEYDYVEEDLDMSVYGRLPTIINDNEIVEAILSEGMNASPSLLMKIRTLRQQCVDRFWIEEVKFLDILSQIIENLIEDPIEKMRINDMFIVKKDVQLEMSNHQGMFTRELQKLEWDSKTTMKKMEEEYTQELERLQDAYNIEKMNKPSRNLLDLKMRLEHLLLRNEIEDVTDLKKEIDETQKKEKYVNQRKAESSRKKAERNLKVKYDRKRELHETRKEYKQRLIRAKEKEALRGYDRLLRRIDGEILSARMNNQRREREIDLQRLPSKPMATRSTSYFEETGELSVRPPLLRLRSAL